MPTKSIVATFLIIGGSILHFFVVWGGPTSIDLQNPEHIAGATGMALPGILIAVIAGLVIGLVFHLFSNERTRSKFFLIFSIFFLITILMITYGTSENRKLEDVGRSETNFSTHELGYLNPNLKNKNFTKEA